MPRKPRLILPNIPVHVVQRGLSKDPVFFEDDDYHAFLDWLVKAKTKHGCAVHAFVLMTNHYHLLLTPPDKKSLSSMMQMIGRHYVPYINHKYGRSGTLWEGRYKANMVQDGYYFLATMRYIEMNPVTAKMVTHPEEYAWSSHARNAYGGKLAWIESHNEYLALGSKPDQRQQSYLALFDRTLSRTDSQVLGNALQTGTPVGDNRFKAKVEKLLGCKVGYDRRGRPWTNRK